MSATATGDHDDRVDARPRRRRLPAGLLRLAPDERLVELLRGGSEGAFEALYARHHRGILSFCRHMLGSAEEAEDAVQHTFLDAYRDLVCSGKDIHLRPWLYAIARNRSLSVLRARRERPADELVEPSTEHLSLEVERRHELRALLGDLAGLPDDQRAALVLAELGDMSHDEIGQALGCPREKVKALVFQARSSLIASRDARDASCAEIREQLANLRGSALRRNVLRRHLRECAGCREFRDQVQAQRRELALILPVAPSLGLKAAVLGGGGAAATSSIVAKTAIVLVVAGGGAAAVETARDGTDWPSPPAAAPEGPRAPAAAGAVEIDAEPTAGPGSQPRGAKVVKARPPKAVKKRPPKARVPKLGRATPPGQAKRSEGFVPPGQAKKSGGFVPPGQAKKSGGFVPPGQAKKSGEAVTQGRAKKPEKVVAPSRAKKKSGGAVPTDPAEEAGDTLPPRKAKKQ